MVRAEKMLRAVRTRGPVWLDWTGQTASSGPARDGGAPLRSMISVGDASPIPHPVAFRGLKKRSLAQTKRREAGKPQSIPSRDGVPNRCTLGNGKIPFHNNPIRARMPEQRRTPSSISFIVSFLPVKGCRRGVYFE